MKKLWLAAPLAIALLVASALPATAEPSKRVVPATMPMSVVGYDQSVAEANGFEIRTLADGTQISVPVTEEAHSLMEQYGAVPVPAGEQVAGGSSVVPLGTAVVRGPCGISDLTLRQSGSNNVAITTGFHVRLPVTTRVWNVTLYGIAGVPTYSFSGGAGAASWTGSRVVSYPTGGAGGWGHVTPGSFVVLTDGAICYSGSPGTGF